MGGCDITAGMHTVWTNFYASITFMVDIALRIMLNSRSVILNFIYLFFFSGREHGHLVCIS